MYKNYDFNTGKIRFRLKCNYYLGPQILAEDPQIPAESPQNPAEGPLPQNAVFSNALIYQALKPLF
jgi:hypothetical protein